MTMTTTTTTTSTILILAVVSLAHYEVQSLKVAVIGAGPAGLVAARVLSRNGITTRVFEKERDVGGVWRHIPDDPTCPMYQGLRTNLPKEIMAYREKPWTDTESTSSSSPHGGSYVTHEEVLRYLKSYKDDFQLDRFIQYGTTVTQLTVLDGTESALSGSTGGKGGGSQSLVGDDLSEDSEEHCPKIRLEFQHSCPEGTADETDPEASATEVFDAICICNGHYAKPSIPSLPGLEEYFTGRVMHAIEYDRPESFAGQTVLCIGARASGADLARELSAHAKHVYLSDSKATRAECHGNLTYVPRTLEIRKDSSVRFERPEHHRDGGEERDENNDNQRQLEKAPRVDLIIFCTGYEYDFPFINEKSLLNLDFVSGERRVMPLYKQLWHAQYPNLAFIGLPHSILPFPLFELQAEAFAAQCLRMSRREDDDIEIEKNRSSGSNKNHHIRRRLPSRRDREREAHRDATSFGTRGTTNVKDTHHLGSRQWDYFRDLAKIAGLYNDKIERFIATNKAIWDHSGQERKGQTPGLPDWYRQTRYFRDPESQSFGILYSALDDSSVVVGGEMSP